MRIEHSFTVVDDFCPILDQVRQSALDSGFGTWAPNKGKVGSSIYEGMNFWGNHSIMMHSLALVMGQAVYPNTMFFRVSNEATEPAYVHSDRETGSFTCVAYLSRHDEEVYGTGFYRHRESGLLEMPPFARIEQMGELGERLKHDMVHGGENEWEQMDFVRGAFNRAVIFKAPLFHARHPKRGIGTTIEDGRMVWVSHFEM